MEKKRGYTNTESTETYHGLCIFVNENKEAAVNDEEKKNGKERKK